MIPLDLTKLSPSMAIAGHPTIGQLRQFLAHTELNPERRARLFESFAGPRAVKGLTEGTLFGALSHAARTFRLPFESCFDSREARKSGVKVQRISETAQNMSEP
jgi:hypothetical protein